MIVPEFLKPEDKIGVVATAKKVDKKNTQKGIVRLNSWNLSVVTGNNLFEEYHQFAGKDEQRIADLQKMINDPDIKAIFMARGGYGTTRIIDSIDYSSLKKYPKWICGFSDVTALHLHLYKMGISSLHAPMLSFFHAVSMESLDLFNQFLFGRKDNLLIDPHKLNRLGHAVGKVVGGNLSIICHTIGTPSEIETKGTIFFIEDVGEKMYHVDRMMVQLKRAGFLSDLAGMIVGQFSEMEDDHDDFGMNVNEIIFSHVEEFDYPIVFDFPVGHTKDNYPIPIGIERKFSVGENAVELNW